MPVASANLRLNPSMTYRTTSFSDCSKASCHQVPPTASSMRRMVASLPLGDRRWPPIRLMAAWLKFNSTSVGG